jgi:O-antigen ligase
MSIYPLFFLFIFFIGSVAAILKDPLWGLLSYVYVYFNIPAQQWWGGQVPSLRWSMISAVILLISCFIHKDKLSLLTLKENKVGMYLLAFLALMIVVMPFTPDPERSWGRIYDFFRYVLIFFIVGKVLSDFRRYKFFIGILSFCTFYLTVLAQHYFHGQRLDGVGLPDGSDANMLAALMVLFIPIFLVIGVTERGWQRWAAFGALPFVLNTFVMCGSRGAFVGLAVQGVIAVWLLRKRIGTVKVLVCCGMMAIILLSLISDQYRNRLLGMESSIKEGSVTESSAGRWEIWKYGIQMSNDYPFGAGGGSFMDLSPAYLPYYLIEKNVGVRASHNTYLQVLVEQGYLGLVIFLGYLWRQFRVLLLTRKMSEDSEKGDTKNKIIFHTYALQIAFAGFWSTAIFVDRLYFEAIYLVVAVVPVLLHLASQIANENSDDLAM